MLEPDAAPLTPAEALDRFGAALGDASCSGLVLAVSGGPDSMALLGLAAALRARLPPLGVATVDHGLRAQSAHEAHAVAAFCREIGLAHTILTWSDPPDGSSSQDAARKARYDLLAALADTIGADHLVTAHTRDDQAETVLLRLAAGSGISGLSAMRVRGQRGALHLLRPLLDVPKSRLIATCLAQNWPFFSDPSNDDPRYARSRMRALMPVLGAQGLSVRRLCRLADRARRLDEALDITARRALAANLQAASKPGVIAAQVSAFATEPFEIALRMLAQAIDQVGRLDPSWNARSIEPPVSLVRLEALTLALRAAVGTQQPFRRTLAGVMLVTRKGMLELRSAPPRRAALNRLRREGSEPRQGEEN